MQYIFTTATGAELVKVVVDHVHRKFMTIMNWFSPGHTIEEPYSIFRTNCLHHNTILTQKIVVHGTMNSQEAGILFESKEKSGIFWRFLLFF